LISISAAADQLPGIAVEGKPDVEVRQVRGSVGYSDGSYTG
jgi:hypothetical protein